MEFKNNITRLLDSRRVAYQVHTYNYDAGVHSATEVAQAIGLPANQVFKTLVVLSDQPRRKPMLVVISGPDTLDMRAFAKAVGVKKAKLATHAEAESLTGLQTGGISPLALINRGFDIYVDDKALAFETIVISAGQRGANLQLPIHDLVKLTGARLLHLAQGGAT